MPTFDTPQPVQLEISSGMGYLEVTATDRKDTVVEVLPRNPNRSGDVSLASDTTVQFANGTLKVLVPKRMAILGPGDSVDVKVACPTGSRLALDVAYGSIRARGVFGASVIKNAYGSIDIEQTGNLRLTAPYGDTQVEKVDGDLDLIAGHGRLRIDEVSGDARIKGSHGELDFGDIAGSIDARTSAGITVEKVGGDVSIRTAHGAARVKSASSGTVRLENGYADVEVGVAHGTAAWVDAASAHGVVRNELTPESGPGAASKTVELRLRANYGDVIIRRAATRKATK